MRVGGVILSFLAISFVPCAMGQEVTLVQLHDFLLAQHKSKRADSDTAGRLSSVTLSERLTGRALSQLVSETIPGPESIGQLRLLADESIFAAPPSGQSFTLPAPSSQAQLEMVGKAAEYARTALQHLPDFLAVRYTHRFDNLPLKLETKHPQPTILLHPMGEFKNQIAYRNGREITEDSRAQPMTLATFHPGLMSMGEFGPILSEVFRDFAQGSVEWARWEIDPAGERLAVFHYVVPKLASHYLVDFCCYVPPGDNSPTLSFRDHPAYHGEVVLSPDSGVIRRITIRADLDASAPVVASELAVQYGEVEIGGQTYVCPVRSIAMTAAHNARMERIDGVGIERHLNEVQFVDYHKFGSTSRIVATP